MTLEARVITDWPTLCSISSEWNHLLRRSASDTVFLTWEWVSAWYESVAPNAQLLTVIVRDDAGKLAAIGPFYLTRMRLMGLVPYRVLRVLGDYHSGAEYPDIILRTGNEDEALEAVAEMLLLHGLDWDCVWMPQMSGWAGCCDRIALIFQSLGLHCHRREHVFSCIDLQGDYEEFLGRVQKRRRRMLRQEEKRLVEQEGATFEQCQNEDAYNECLEALFDLHHRRWSSRGESGSFVREPAMVAFYRTFSRVARSCGWLRLYGLRVRGEIKAALIGYRYGETFYSLQQGFDPEGPPQVSNVLLAMAIRSLIAEGVKAYDHLGGFTEHKAQWGAAPRTGHDLFVGRRTLKNRLLFYKEVWPFGRFIIEDHPAGRSGQ